MENFTPATQNPKKSPYPHILNWQIAYAARDLRLKKATTLSCLKTEQAILLKQLSSFSNSNPVMARSTASANSEEIVLEIIDI